MSELTIPDSPKYSFNHPPNNIIFYDTSKGYQREVLRITRDGIIGNPDVPTDEAADAVIRLLDGHIKSLTKRTWVGLTDEEIDKTYETQVWDARRSYARALEAKLKQKNGYNT
jgi:hypothetical protein